MRNFYLAVLCFCFASISYAQLQFVTPNPACQNGAYYCRDVVTPLPNPNSTTPGVIGFDGHYLYSQTRIDSGACPGTTWPTSSYPAFCFYTADQFAPENWYFRAQYPARDVYTADGLHAEGLIEMVFAANCSASGISYKYVYTNAQRILRATSSVTDWGFKDIAHPDPQNGFSGLPGLPSETLGLTGVFAIANQGSRTRIFYGNKPDQGGPPQGSFVWHSDDCGKTWTNSLAVHPGGPNTADFGCSEVHAIEVDPANAWNVYANLDCEQINPPTAGGLWQSTDGGDNFRQVQIPNTVNGNFAVGLNMVFPSATNKVLMEVDVQPVAPLTYWDKVNGGPLHIAAPFPYPGFTPDISTSLILTSEQNLFVVTNGGAQGFWYFAPPFYDAPFLLDSPNPPVGFATRTVEVTAPMTNKTYLYSGYSRIGKPKFITPQLPAAGSALTSFVDQNSGSQHWAYLGTDRHLYDVFWNSGSGIGFSDLTAATGAPLASVGSALTSYQVGTQWQWFYLGTDGHLDHVLCDSGGAGCGFEDLTVTTGAPVPAAGSALTSFVDSNWGQHWGFVGADQHVYQAFWTGGFGYQDLTAATGAPLASVGSALTSYQVGTQWQWYFFDTNGQLDHVLCDSLGSGCWVAYLTGVTGAPPSAAGSALTSFVDSNWGQHWAYMGTNHHVYELFWTGGYGFVDLHAR